MKRRWSHSWQVLLFSACMTQNAAAEPVALNFLPPQLPEQNICNQATDEEPGSTAEQDDGTAMLTDIQRSRFLRNLIRDLQEEDAERWFDFTKALIVRRQEVDENFTEIDADLALVELMVLAGRMDQLDQMELIARLRERVPQMTNNQRVTLAQYFAEGSSIAQDTEFAQSLIREAAYEGNAKALLEIVRMEIQGTLLDGWDAPLDMTLTMAFGGILGDLSPKVCHRAELIAQEFDNGRIVQRNPAIALAWRRFAADMGSGTAAWRVVEHHLNASTENLDTADMRHYLRRAATNGAPLSGEQRRAVLESGIISAQELEDLIGFNHNSTGPNGHAAIVPLLTLDIKIDNMVPPPDRPYRQFLSELTGLPETPGWVFTKLAKETRVSKGYWASEPEVSELLEKAVQLGDGEAMQLLAELLIRYRRDPRLLARAESLLFESISRYGMPHSMDMLDRLYRCQVPDAPRVKHADIWAQSYKAAGYESVHISPTDLAALDPIRDPEIISIIQTQALTGRSQAIAQHAIRIQNDPGVSEETLRFWATQLERSDKALELYTELVFDLATDSRQRDFATELFRRVFLNNGVASALDTAVALIEYQGRDPEIFKEIIRMLTMAGNRGEGAAIRLLSRLQASTRPASDVYAQFSDTIEDRGDFLALMFAIPFLHDTKVDDYVDRAVSIMNCGTKDADELGDAFAHRQNAEASYHWRRIGLTFTHGHVLSKLGLSDPQMEMVNRGNAPSATEIALRKHAEGDEGSVRRLIRITSDPQKKSYDPKAAALHFVDAVSRRNPEDVNWLLRHYRTLGPEIRKIIRAKIDVEDFFTTAASGGSPDAQYEFGMFLREDARDLHRLRYSLGWLKQAAAAGHVAAMAETGYALGFGIGTERDIPTALSLLRNAAEQGSTQASQLVELLSAMADQSQ